MPLSLMTNLGLDGYSDGVASGAATLLSKFSAYYDLTDNSTSNDLVAGNNLTATGSPSFLGGSTPAGYVQLTAASSQYLSRATFAAVEPQASQSLCVCAWVYADTLPAGMPIVGKWRSGDNEYLLQFNATSARFLGRNAANTATTIITNGATLVTGAWNYIVCGYDFLNAQLYFSLNGAAKTTAAAGTGLRVGGTALFQVGRQDTATTMNGRITRVGIGRFVPIAAEITHLYNAGAGRLYSEITI